ncbi:MAG TPA: YcaO-like family protein [Candidatus Elarobacter sp.]|jgi:ribosomal protein S12 methylthiotransferase accessory factor
MTATLVLAEGARTPLERSLPKLRTLLSPLTGIVPATWRVLNATEDPPFHHVCSLTTDTRALLGVEANKINGGIAPSADAALAAAIGESAERYAAAHVPAERCTLASAADLGERAVDPASFGLFADVQYADPAFPFARFDSQTRVRWVEGHALDDGRSVRLPAQLVYLAPPGAGETAISYSTSSGLACGATLEEAILGGLLELVERDAFLVTWCGRLRLPRVRWDDDGVLAAEERRYYHGTGLEYVVTDASAVLGVPTAIALVGARNGAHGVAVGAASAVTMRHAVHKALREGFQTRAFARQLAQLDPGWTCADDYSSVHSFDDHVRFYGCPQNAVHADFLRGSDAWTRAGDVPGFDDVVPARAIAGIVERLALNGVHVYVADVTTPDLLDAGLRVARVIAPELCRLDVDYRLRFLGARRLLTGGFEAGLTSRPLLPAELNPHPHPFP